MLKLAPEEDMLIEEEVVPKNELPVQKSETQIPMNVALIQKLLGYIGSLARNDVIPNISAFPSSFL